MSETIAAYEAVCVLGTIYDEVCNLQRQKGLTSWMPIWLFVREEELSFGRHKTRTVTIRTNNPKFWHRAETPYREIS